MCLKIILIKDFPTCKYQLEDNSMCAIENNALSYENHHI